MTKSGLVFAVVLLIAVTSCTSTPEDTTSTSTTTESTTTTTLATTTSSTLSDAEVRRLAIEQAETDITEVVEAWFTYPFDSAQGDEGAGLEYLVTPIRERFIELVAQYDADGQIRRARGSSAIQVTAVEIDLANGVAQALACGLGDHELVDAETSQVIVADDDSPASLRFELKLDGDVWKISDFFNESSEGETCSIE